MPTKSGDGMRGKEVFEVVMARLLDNATLAAVGHPMPQALRSGAGHPVTDWWCEALGI